METPYQLFFCLALTSVVAELMVMQENDETGNTLSVDYTFDPHFALGLHAKGI